MNCASARSSVSRLLLTLALIFVAAKLAAADPLPSWNDTPTKRAILQFVTEVTTDGPHYVPPEARIATFDNDGTLWCEYPMYPQLVFTTDRVKTLIDQHPDWQREDIFRAAAAYKLGETSIDVLRGLVPMSAAVQAGFTTKEFGQTARQWLTTAKHPRFQRPYTECVYQPMLELMAYLRTQDFQVYICSGGGAEFIRAFALPTYSVAPEQVIGSYNQTALVMRDGEPAIMILDGIEYFCDGPTKPLGIHRAVGRRPILAFGNSDGDLAMLQWTAAGEGRRLMCYVHHTDAEREYAYDRESPIGRLAAGLDAARANNWVLADMKRDWKVVFPVIPAPAEPKK